MPEVLEIEQTTARKNISEEDQIASWLADIPENVIKALNLPEGSRVALTVKNGEVSGDLLPPRSDRMREISQRVFENNREVYEELKRIGD